MSLGNGRSACAVSRLAVCRLDESGFGSVPFGYFLKIRGHGPLFITTGRFDLRSKFMAICNDAVDV